jgi:hypothetical protein
MRFRGAEGECVDGGAETGETRARRGRPIGAGVDGGEEEAKTLRKLLT